MLYMVFWNGITVWSVPLKPPAPRVRTEHPPDAGPGIHVKKPTITSKGLRLYWIHYLYVYCIENMYVYIYMYRFTIYIYICVYVGYNDFLPKHLGVSLKTVWPGKIIFQHIFHPTRPLFHSHHFFGDPRVDDEETARPSHQPLTLTNELPPYHGLTVLGKKRVASEVYLYINYLQKMGSFQYHC